MIGRCQEQKIGQVSGERRYAVGVNMIDVKRRWVRGEVLGRCQHGSRNNGKRHISKSYFDAQEYVANSIKIDC